MKEESAGTTDGAYQATGKYSQDGRDRTEGRPVDPNNLKALALLVVGKRMTAKTPQDPRHAATVCREGSPGAPDLAQAGKEWQTPIFRSSRPNECDLQRCVGMTAFRIKTNSKAEKNLRAAVDADPTDVNTSTRCVGLSHGWSHRETRR